MELCKIKILHQMDCPELSRCGGAERGAQFINSPKHYTTAAAASDVFAISDGNHCRQMHVAQLTF
jgi:hypothetical protein